MVRLRFLTWNIQRTVEPLELAVKAAAAAQIDWLLITEAPPDVSDDQVRAWDPQLRVWAEHANRARDPAKQSSRLLIGPRTGWRGVRFDRLQRTLVEKVERPGLGRVTLAVTHGYPQTLGPAERRSAAGFDARGVWRTAGSLDALIVVGGDFNMEPWDAEMWEEAGWHGVSDVRVAIRAAEAASAGLGELERQSHAARTAGESGIAVDGKVAAAKRDDEIRILEVRRQWFFNASWLAIGSSVSGQGADRPLPGTFRHAGATGSARQSRFFDGFLVSPALRESVTDCEVLTTLGGERLWHPPTSPAKCGGPAASDHFPVRLDVDLQTDEETDHD